MKSAKYKKIVKSLLTKKEKISETNQSGSMIIIDQHVTLAIVLKSPLPLYSNTTECLSAAFSEAATPSLRLTMVCPDKVKLMTTILKHGLAKDIETLCQTPLDKCPDRYLI